MAFQPDHFRHPNDAQSLMNLKAVKWVERLSRNLVADDLEHDLLMLNLCDNVELTRTDHPDIHEAIGVASDAFGMPQPPRVFLDSRLDPQTTSFGRDEPILVVTTSLLEKLDEAEHRLPASDFRLPPPSPAPRHPR